MTLARVVVEEVSGIAESELRDASMTSLEGAPRLTDAVRHLLAPLTQSVPDAGAEILTSGTYLVEFSSDGRADLATGAVEFLRRRSGRLQPTLVRSGRFDENAVLVGSATTNVVKAALVAKVAVLLIVQAQLVEMERQLHQIKSRVQQVRDMLDDQQLTLISGRLKALQKIRDQVADSDWSSEDQVRFNIALDQADTEFHQVGDYATAQVERHVAATREIRTTVSFFGTRASTVVEEFADVRQRHQVHAILRDACLVGRCIVARMRASLTGRGGVDDLVVDLNAARESARAYGQLVEQKADEFTTQFRRASFEVSARKRMREDAREAVARTIRVLDLLDQRTREISVSGRTTTRALVCIERTGVVGDIQVLSQAGP